MLSSSPSPRLSSVSIQTEDFDLSAEVAALRSGDAGVGAIATFVGTVRDRHAGQPERRLASARWSWNTTLACTERSIEVMIDDAFRRFDIRGVRVIHRVGPLQIADQIVLVAVTSMHRGESFQACEFLMDYLKSEAPFWKKETTPEGARWVDARVSDDAALRRWGIVSGNATGA